MTKGNNSARDKAAFRYLQDRNVFWGEPATFSHCRAAEKIIDHLAIEYDRLLGHDYKRGHNEVVSASTCSYAINLAI